MYPEKLHTIVNQISELTLKETADLNELLKVNETNGLQWYSFWLLTNVKSRSMPCQVLDEIKLVIAQVWHDVLGFRNKLFIKAWPHCDRIGSRLNAHCLEPVSIQFDRVRTVI